MEQSLTRRTRKNWRGQSIFQATFKISMTPPEYQVAKSSGLLSKYPSHPKSLLSAKRTDTWQWLAKFLVAKATRQLVTVRMMLRGVTFKSKDIVELTQIESVVLTNISGLGSTLVIAANYDDHQ